jgi:hypothetical protein
MVRIMVLGPSRMPRAGSSRTGFEPNDQIRTRGLKRLKLSSAPLAPFKKTNQSPDIGRYNIIDIISYHYITFSRILIFFISFFKR